MIATRISLLGALLGVTFLLSSAAQSRAGLPRQDEPAVPKPKVLTPAGPGEAYKRSMKTMHASCFSSNKRGWSGLRTGRGEAPKDAAETYEQLFRIAVTNNLFREAEPAAQQVLKALTDAPPIVQFLARTIDVIASADRGAYDESLADLHSLVEATKERRGTANSPTAAL